MSLESKFYKDYEVTITFVSFIYLKFKLNKRFIRQEFPLK